MTHRMISNPAITVKLSEIIPTFKISPLSLLEVFSPQLIHRRLQKKTSRNQHPILRKVLGGSSDFIVFP